MSIAGFLDFAERYQHLGVHRPLGAGQGAHPARPSRNPVARLRRELRHQHHGPVFKSARVRRLCRSEIKSALIPAGMLDFELTETAALRNLKATTRFIARMADIGARVALDDWAPDSHRSRI